MTKTAGKRTLPGQSSAASSDTRTGQVRLMSAQKQAKLEGIEVEC